MRSIVCFYSLMLFVLPVCALAETTGELAATFNNPPACARPHVFWYWMNGNISREGLTADLEAMQRAGIGGAMIFNIGSGGVSGPNIGSGGVSGPVEVLSPEWRGLMQHAIQEASRLGIEIALNNSMSGWSSSGGPWITPEIAMKKVTWSATHVSGAEPASGWLVLPKPEVNHGFYQDIAVVAFPTPHSELTNLKPVITAGDPSVDLQRIVGSEIFPGGSNWDENMELLRKRLNPIRFGVQTAGTAPTVQWVYEAAFPACSLHIGFFSKGSNGVLQSSDDGINWREVKTFKQRHLESINIVFKAMPARYWRVVFEKDKDVTLTALKLNAGYRIEDWTGKAMYDSYGIDRPAFTESALEAPSDCVIKQDTVIDLSSKMDADGKLNWKVPDGNWTILRFGYTPTGSTVGPAVAGGDGLECDKFDRAALDYHFKHSLQPWFDDEELNDTIRSVHIDSYERGAQNWTAAFSEEFKSRCSYDMLSYLPILTGRVVKSVRYSERFLWDFRRTATALMQENYFRRMKELCAGAGKQFSCEPYHQNQFNTIGCGSEADIPMCEVWMGAAVPGSSWWVKRGASAANIYGKQLVGCEAFTAPGEYGGSWNTDFWDMKELGDYMFCGGVNRMNFHVYVHQPWVDNIMPGQTLAVFGTHFERTNTWWEQMPGFTKYISRCQHVLQQGRPVADILYSCGENSPNGSIEPRGRFALPPGYDYDVCDPDALFNRINVKNGRYFLPDGGSYSLLVLPDDKMMTLKMLKRLAVFLENGASIVMPRPSSSPSLTGYPDADEGINILAERVWNTYSDQIFWDVAISEVLEKMKLVPDYKAAPVSPFRTIHKKVGGEDVYFVANATTEQVKVKATFRIGRGYPQIWCPRTGEIRGLPDYTQTETETVIPLEFAAREAYFIVFSKTKPSQYNQYKKNFPEYKTIASIAGGWSVQFDHRWGGPAEPVDFEMLQDWAKRPEEGIKYYSGTAVYHKTFDLPEGFSRGERLYLSLGEFNNVAGVRVNGKDAGVVWCAPRRVEITNLVEQKNNRLEIYIVNLWVNRLLGDEQLPEDVKYSTGVWHQIQEWPQWLTNPEVKRNSGRYTFTTFNHWNEDKKNSPLMPSGLLGPVTLQSETWTSCRE